MKKYVTIIWMFILCIASAQPQHENMRPRAMERLESFKKVRMLETLKLDEQTGLKLVNKYTKHREMVKDIEQQRSKIIDKLEEQVKGNVSDAEYQKTFSEFIDIESKIAEARGKFLIELKEILTSKQIAEYMIFERNFARDLRDIMKDLQKERQKRD